MTYFVFRNMTVENLFTTFETESGGKIVYSGYEDLSYIDSDADAYIWWYMAPYKPEREQAAAAIDNYVSLLTLVLQGISTAKMVIALTIEPIFEVTCITSQNTTKEAINRYNNKLYELSDKYKNLKVLDFSNFTRGYSKNQLIDWKYYFLSQMALNPRLARPFGEWFQKQLQAINLYRKKCLVLDLDNTLWGGILGEGGVHGVKIGGDYPGNAYLNFQKYIIALQQHGVILAICSKNNLKDVEQLWTENPNNLIRRELISAHRINWQDKATNIREIANELNIGTDSMVFIDDNPAERELVRVMLPEVAVPDFPTHPYELPLLAELITCNYFQVYNLTKEDKHKTEQYRANAERIRTQSIFPSMEDYLRSLEIELTISEANAATMERIVQMTQKTNQFNLTTKRYTQADIEILLEAGAKIWTLGVKDRFGDHGISGLVIVIHHNNCAAIDTLLLSCRILGKGIENEFVKACLQRLYQIGIQEVAAEYIPTAKNGQVAAFYEKLGFTCISPNKYRKKLDANLESTNEIYRII